MSGFILIIIWLGVLSVFAASYPTIEYVALNKNGTYRTKLWFAFVSFLPVIVWAGFRDGQGWVDTNAYISMYKTFPDTFSEMFPFLSTVQKDVGFSVFGTLIKIIFGTGYTPFLFIIAFIQGIVIITFFRRYSESFLMSLFLFIATGEYLAWMFNGIRQFLAVVIVVACTPWILKKKYLQTIVVILIAATIHQTALLMIPVIFIVQGKPWSKKVLFIIIMAIVILFSIDRFTNVLDSMLSNTQYYATVSTWQASGDDGTSPIRVIVYAIPTMLAFLGRKQIGNQNKIINICINMSVISTVLYLVSMMTSGIMMGRLPIYVSLYNYILLPYELKNIFNKDSAKIMWILTIICYLLYYYYLLHFAYERI